MTPTLSSLQTLTDAQRERRASPKLTDGKSRRAVNGAKRNADAAAIVNWRTAVYARDRYRCRDCGRKVRRTLEHVPDQAQAHHIASRADAAVRHDRRNGVTLCGSCHDAVERNQVMIIGPASATFRVNGKTYLNGDSPLLKFVTKTKKHNHGD